ncbi:HDOD domain-containing protein [Paraneptunicella aestuarii]|uniref:EAL and HDOD domain-containing protein n=1 Tax=Paraneptunicella aestuarii TaxID=2831148 RepID=UPI001E538467|nr:HDOD domain-containing protein [Paraneptunicella aestuarii]UAA38531.1 HDOD domain-containing protein [Paraneptunicella aestuarii]
MFAYVARQAILDRDLEIQGYELLFRDGKQNCFPEIEPDEATSKLLTSAHLTLGLEEITEGKTAFVNFYEDTLLHGFPTSLDPKLVVIELIETAPITEGLVAACKHISGLGYKIALDDHNFDPKWEVLLPYTSILKVDIREMPIELTRKHIPKYIENGVKLVAEKVETYDEFHAYRELGFDLFQGYFFAKPEVIRKKELPASKMSLMQLMVESAAKEMDYDKINKIIEHDVSLSYMLLRFINNPLFNKRQKISSLRHALNYMGDGEVKKFIALLALANLGQEKPGELLAMSLIRAKFCELVAKECGESDNPPKGFLVGLFSLLDALLDKRMPDLMQKLPILDELKGALCGQKNALFLYLELVKCFEVANWNKVRAISNRIGVEQRKLHGAYNQSIVWSHAMTSCVN